MRPQLRLLAPDAVERTIGEACRVLERVGVVVENVTARELLLAAGAETRAGRIHLPERLPREAVATAPARFALHDRAGEPAVLLGEGATHFDPGSAAIYRLDASTGRRRPASSAEVVDLVRLVDALPHYAAQATALVPADVPDEIADRWRLYLALLHGSKPVVTGVFRADGFAPMMRLLAAVRGGEAELADRPLALFDCCPTSPLSWSELAAGTLVAAARAGAPANLIAVPLTGATAPVTLADALVQLAAENLAGVAIHQLAAPGAPLVWGGAPAAFDMRHGAAAMGAVESSMLNAANAQIGRHLGLPTHGYLGLSDAKTPDYQAGAESATGALVGALAGIDLVSGPGLLDFLLTQSLEKLLLDHEACGAALRFQRGVGTPDEDALALFADLVATGELLSHGHTRAHWRRELSIASPLVDRASYGDWESAGGHSALERANEEVARRRARPAVPLADPAAAELRSIVRADAARLGLDADRLPFA